MVYGHRVDKGDGVGDVDKKFLDGENDDLR